MQAIQMQPIGTVRSSRKKAEDDNWDTEQASIELDHDRFTSDALLGLSDFSHVEILFHMNKVDPQKIEMTARHPRNNPDWPKVGIFAQRGKNRPNQIGATICRVLKIDGLHLYVEGLDAIDGSPVLDIKPWVNEFAPRGTIFQPSWTSELMTNYWIGSQT
jgi:tRNA-Thr(GGU) m(6)t(6)A37 methyltransferase TsaA